MQQKLLNRTSVFTQVRTYLRCLSMGPLTSLAIAMPFTQRRCKKGKVYLTYFTKAMTVSNQLRQ